MRPRASMCVSGARASRSSASAVRGEAVLGLFVGELYFDQDGECFVESCGGGVQALGGFEGVEGVDGVEEFGGFGGLVVLQRADEVQFDARRERLTDADALDLHLLDAVFAEEALAGGVGFEDRFGGMHF